MYRLLLRAGSGRQVEPCNPLRNFLRFTKIDPRGDGRKNTISSEFLCGLNIVENLSLVALVFENMALVSISEECCLVARFSSSVFTG